MLSSAVKMLSIELSKFREICREEGNSHRFFTLSRQQTFNTVAPVRKALDQKEFSFGEIRKTQAKDPCGWPQK